MARYDGQTEDGMSLSTDEPYVVMGWPTEEGIRQFTTEQCARDFIADACKFDRFASFARLYAFKGNRWERLPA